MIVGAAPQRASSRRPSASRPGSACHAGRRRRDPVAGRPLGRHDRRPRSDLTFRDALGHRRSPRRSPSFPGISRSGITHLGRPVRRPDPRGRGPVRVPDGDPGHRRGRRLSRPASCSAARPACAASSAPLLVGHDRGPRSGMLAIRFLLRYLRTQLARHLRRLPGRRRRVVFVVCPARAESRLPPMEVMKQLRQRAIRDLLEQRPIRTQQELAAALRERGFRTTQATISRDVAELGPDQGRPARAPRPTRCRRGSSRPRRQRRGPAAQALLRDLPVEIREAGLLLVLRTLPGSAHAIAAALDRARWPEVAGSIAGDDTLFVAFADRGSLGPGQAPPAAPDRASAVTSGRGAG